MKIATSPHSGAEPSLGDDPSKEIQIISKPVGEMSDEELRAEIERLQALRAGGGSSKTPRSKKGAPTVKKGLSALSKKGV